MYAAGLSPKGGMVETLRLLLGHGAGARLKDKAGRTALDYARAEKHEAAVAILRGCIKPGD